MAAAARRMHDRRVKRLLVVDDDAGRLAGIVSRVDVLSVFDRPDDEIRDEVVKEIIAGEFVLDPNAFDVTVRSGIVTVTGQVENRAIAPLLIAAIRHAEGVVGVRNRLSFPQTIRMQRRSGGLGYPDNGVARCRPAPPARPIPELDGSGSGILSPSLRPPGAKGP